MVYVRVLGEAQSDPGSGECRGQGSAHQHRVREGSAKVTLADAPRLAQLGERPEGHPPLGQGGSAGTARGSLYLATGSGSGNAPPRPSIRGIAALIVGGGRRSNLLNRPAAAAEEGSGKRVGKVCPADAASAAAGSAPLPLPLPAAAWMMIELAIERQGGAPTH